MITLEERNLMSKTKNKIYRPKKGTDVPEAARFDPETGEPKTVDRKKLLSQWLKDSKKTNIGEEESYAVSIDPKQAFYARKKRKED